MRLYYWASSGVRPKKKKTHIKNPAKKLEVAENSEPAAEIATEHSKGLSFSLSHSKLCLLSSTYSVIYHINVLIPLIFFCVLSCARDRWRARVGRRSSSPAGILVDPFRWNASGCRRSDSLAHMVPSLSILSSKIPGNGHGNFSDH